MKKTLILLAGYPGTGKSYMANIIIAYNGPRAGEIMHIIYNDNGVTKIKTFGTENLLDDALKGTFNNKTLTNV